MKMESLLILVIVTHIVMEASAWSFSNLLMSGSKASHIFSESVAIAAQKGMEECRSQFLWEKWDCPRSSFNVFSKSNGQPATSEMAFLHAIVSAAIVITLTRNCSLGHFDSCGCDETKKGAIGLQGWSWGGCSDNVKFGEKMAKEFLDAREVGMDAKALINLHNNKMGRTVSPLEDLLNADDHKIVKKTMRKMCKCHGVSGSCATQTCWMRMADLRMVGNRLKAAFKEATKVESNDYGALLPTRHLRRQRTRNAIPKLRVPRHHLIYMESSPDYCIANVTAGVQGTRGRLCSRKRGPEVSETEKLSCRTLCRGCGLKVRRKMVQIVSSCRCKFYWCCDVRCDVCKERVLQHVCF